MTTALWIIAIVETIRMIEQSIQLKIIANDTGKRDNVYEELVKSFKASDREYVRNLLEAFDKQDEPQTDCPYREYPCAVCDEQTDCPWK